MTNSRARCHNCCQFRELDGWLWSGGDGKWQWQMAMAMARAFMQMRVGWVGDYLSQAASEWTSRVVLQPDSMRSDARLLINWSQQIADSWCAAPVCKSCCRSCSGCSCCSCIFAAATSSQSRRQRNRCWVNDRQLLLARATLASGGFTLRFKKKKRLQFDWNFSCGCHKLLPLPWQPHANGSEGLQHRVFRAAT